MRCRPVDEYGDWYPIGSKDEMITGPVAVALAVDARIGLPRGEWWEDEEFGFQLPEMLVNTVKVTDVPMVASYISTYVKATPGVISVSDAQFDSSDLRMSYSCTIHTREGSANVEVNEDELLPAIY